MSQIPLIIVGTQASIAASLMTLTRQRHIRVVACLNDANDLFTRLTETEPMIVLIDYTAITEAHYPLLTQLHRSYPKTKVILLCEGVEQAKIIEVFRYGASGYVEAKDREDFLTKAIYAINDGEAWVPRLFASNIIDRLL